MQHPEPTGAVAEEKATKAVSDMVICLHGELAASTRHTGVVDGTRSFLHRVQEHSDLQIRRLNAAKRNWKAATLPLRRRASLRLDR
eukprot:1942087-Pyramimonas_sp.AAC.1